MLVFRFQVWCSSPPWYYPRTTIIKFYWVGAQIIDRNEICVNQEKKNYDMNAFTPLSPGCDQDRISPYTISTISSRQVMRIKKNINYRWNQFQILQTSIIWIVRQKVRRITDEILGVKGLGQILAPSHQFFGSLVSKLKNSCWHWKRKSKAKQRKFSLERKFSLFFCYFPFVLSGCCQYAFSQNSRPCSFDLRLNVLAEVYWISCKCDNTEKIVHYCFS